VPFFAIFKVCVLFERQQQNLTIKIILFLRQKKMTGVLTGVARALMEAVLVSAWDMSL
jgi:hypothetical protein